MTDTLNVPAPAAPVPADPQIADHRAYWIANGGDAAAFDRAVAGEATADRTSSEPAHPDTPAHKTWSDGQAASLIADLRSQGVTDERLTVALRGDGYSDAEIAALLAAVVDGRSDDEKALQQGGLTPGRAQDYRPISYTGRLPAGADLHAFDAAAKEFMVSIEAPALLGPSLVEEIMDQGQAYGRMSEAGQALWRLEQDQALLSLLGPGEAKDAIDLAASVLAKAPLPFVEALQASGALRSAQVIVQLARIGDLSNVRAQIKAGGSLAELGG